METFSRETKKIVQLTPDEIRRRLRKILTAFSEKGGFGVLLAVIYEETDLEVLKAAMALIKDFKTRLDTYSYQVIETMQIDGERRRVSEEEIDHLALAYAKLRTNDGGNVIQQNGVCNGDDNIEKIRIHFGEHYYKNFAQIGGDEFVELIDHARLDEVIEAKQNWLNSCNGFGSLVDDILLSFSSEPYDLECY